jgi:hypothetical protein
MKNDWTITKRHLGLALIVAGVVGATGVVVLDALRRSNDFGPAQQFALIGCLALAALGGTLLPLGDHPA